jgi:hypothetical protein
MNKLFILLSLAPLTVLATVCPDLSGTYHCTFSNQRYSPLKIEQKVNSESDTEMVTYSFTYTAFSSYPEIFQAGPQGEADGSGWINKCYRNTLRSLYYDGSMMGEIFLDQNNAFVRRLNGRVVQQCPRKRSE